MKANNLTICLPTTGCTRNCDYCISKMTPSAPHPLKYLSSVQLRKATSFGKTSGVNSVLLTARGEPLLSYENVLEAANVVSKDFLLPCELQTNGDLLTVDKIEELIVAGIDVFAISINSPLQPEEQQKVMAYIRDYNKVLRWTVLLHDMNMEFSYVVWIKWAKEARVNQLSFRKLTIPSIGVGTEYDRWIMNHTPYDNEWVTKLKNYCDNSPIVRKLSFGPTIVDIEGIAVTYFPYCLDIGENSEEFRSLILREDGHLYTAWDSLASILF